MCRLNVRLVRLMEVEVNRGTNMVKQGMTHQSVFQPLRPLARADLSFI